MWKVAWPEELYVEDGMEKPKVALLWDESFVWALMAYRSFRHLGIDTDIVTSAGVKDGALGGYDLLAVPGGWASDKTVRLGHEGADAIRGFVSGGGGYLGLCGGAGLALDVKGGLSLTHAARVPTAHRVPSFSGEIVLAPCDASHPIWSGVRKPYSFHAWWPGQFHLGTGDGIEVVARYERPGRDFCLADLPAGDVSMYDGSWTRWEDAYGINLDPARLTGEPAMIETTYGDGRVFLSYLHLETPGSRKGNAALVNLAGHLSQGSRRPASGKTKGRPASKTYPISREARIAASSMMRAASGFIEFGERNFLWYWRNSWMLQWRRGVRGVEYSMLYGLVREVHAGLKTMESCPDEDISERVISVSGRVAGFLEDARVLLMKERFALMNGSMSTINCDDEDVTKLRERLFSGGKRLGGEFKEILDILDGIVLAMLRQ